MTDKWAGRAQLPSLESKPPESTGRADKQVDRQTKLEISEYLGLSTMRKKLRIVVFSGDGIKTIWYIILI